MRKFTLFFVMLFMFSSLFVFGESPYVFIVNGDSIADDGSICINHDNQELVTVSYITEAIRQDGNTQHISATWESVGDVTIVETSGNSATIRSTDLAKGVIRLKYNREGCGVFVKNLHVYKSFSPSLYGLEIEGPDCLTPGEVVVYSVRPALTRNLNAYIGVDNYYWNLTDSLNKPSFVDRIVYAAGDGSSVTFIAGTVHVGDEIQVNFGQCNIEASKAVRKSVGKIPPAPIVESQTLCVPYGNGVRKVIKVETALDGVEYTCSVPSQFSSRKLNDSVFEIGFDKLSADDIKIRASYVGEEACGSSETTIHVVRTWGSNVELVYSGGSQCCAVIGQGSYKFIVQGDIPTNSEFYWQLPRGWVKDESISEGQSISIYPTRDALPVDTLKVWGDACNNEDVIIKSIPVYVCPATVDYIEHPACITPGDSVIFRVRLNNDGVTPIAYRWTTSDGLDLSQFVGDSVAFAPTITTDFISVLPMGFVCDGSVYLDSLFFKPVAPSGIESTGCITAGMEDTLSLFVARATSNERYEWILPNDMLYVDGDDNKSHIQVLTSGLSGTSEIKVYALNSCGASDTISSLFETSEVGCTVEHFIIRNYTTIYVASVPDPDFNVHCQWYHNGEFYSEGIEDSPRLPNSEALGVWQVIVTLPDGCKQSVMYSIGDSHANAPSRSASAAVDLTSLESESVTMYPNPVNNLLHIDLPDNNEIANVVILSMDGRLVARHKISNMNAEISMNDLQNGTYHVVVYQGNMRSTSVVIVKH